MKTKPVTFPAWSTSSFGEATTTSAMELSLLGAHLAMCRRQHGGLVLLRGAAESMKGFLAARFVTTLVVVTLVGVAGLRVV